MAVYFFDASALVKRYLRETGSAWVRDFILREQPQVFVSSLSGPEVVSAVMRKSRAGEVTPAERDRVMRAFRDEFVDRYARINPEPAVIERAIDLIAAHPLRAYDAVQLASALSLPPLPHGETLVFLTADAGLLAVTRQLGSAADNPELHA